jgi:G6PDH family F420-dependent oxidoreductase
MNTDTLGLATGVTCPTVRYHPAIIAQAAATLAIISDGRFTLGIGAGERLNEHVVGQGFPSVRGRHERLVEALEIINLLWQGGYQSYEGRHLQLEDARVFDLPDKLPVIAVAAGGERAAQLAATHGSGLFVTEPRPELAEAYQKTGGQGPRYAEVATAWAPSAETAVQAALRTSAWSVTGWKVMSELPNPANFEAASATVRPEDIRENFAVGPDPQPYVEAVRKYAEAGYDHIALLNAGPDPDGFLDFFAKELRQQL